MVERVEMCGITAAGGAGLATWQVAKSGVIWTRVKMGRACRLRARVLEL